MVYLLNEWVNMPSLLFIHLTSCYIVRGFTNGLQLQIMTSKRLMFKK